MPDLIAREPVEDYKVTKEHKAFLKNVQRINAVKNMIDRGLMSKMQELKALQTFSQDLAGKRKELMLRAPEQSVLDVEDEGMIE